MTTPDPEASDAELAALLEETRKAIERAKMLIEEARQQAERARQLESGEEDPSGASGCSQ